MTPEEQALRAHEEIERIDLALKRSDEAKRVLAMPIVSETLDTMEKELHEAWMACPARDVEGREWIWRQSTAVRQFRGMLRTTMESGKFAMERKKSLIETIRNAAKKVANWG